MDKGFEIKYITFKMPNSNEFSTTIHLSNTIQNYLTQNDSTTILDKTYEGELSIASAFIFRKEGRGFDVSKESSFDESYENITDLYVIYLRENNFCFARAKIHNLKRLSELIYEWMDKDKKIEELQNKFSNLELFQPIQDLPPYKYDTWNNIKNFIFTFTNFHIEDNTKKNWVRNYNRMLEAISKNNKFDKYIPFTSHYNLHLNNSDKSLKWHFIIPTENGQYLVAEQIGLAGIKPEIHEIFNSIEEVMEFYYELLKKLESKVN